MKTLRPLTSDMFVLVLFLPVLLKFEWVGVLRGFGVWVGSLLVAFLGWGASALGFLCGLRRVITKVDSKIRSLDSPVWAEA